MIKLIRRVMPCVHLASVSTVTTVLLAAALLTTTVSAQAQRQVLDRVIAIVDDGVILQSEYDERMQEIQARARQSGMQLPPADALREQVMENLIIESLQLQLAERVGIRFDDDTLNRVMTDVAQQNGLTFDQYVSALQSQGAYLATRESIRRELAVNEVQRGMVNQRINITDQEIENYLNSEMGRTATSPDYLVNQILVPVSSGESAAVEQSRQAFAQELTRRLQAGEDFAQVAQDAQTNANDQGFNLGGGELGWRKTEQLPSLFQDIVPNMIAGQASDPVRSANGFHVIYLANVRGDTGRLVPQTKVRHILIAPNEIRTEEQARRLIDNIYQRLQDGENFNVLARQYSDDNMSVVAGGDLGWVNQGGMPPEFEEVVNAMPIGEVSEPFHTSFGWHVAEVMDRREQDLSPQLRRQQAEAALRNRKFNIELENWMLELRDEAYVKFIN